MLISRGGFPDLMPPYCGGVRHPGLSPDVVYALGIQTKLDVERGGLELLVGNTESGNYSLLSYAPGSLEIQERRRSQPRFGAVTTGRCLSHGATKASEGNW